MNSVFVDTNVLLRHLLQDHEDHSPRASKLISDIANGKLTAYISETVVFETIFTSLSFYKISRAVIAETLSELLLLNGFQLERRQELLEAMRLWALERSLSFADCYHLVLTKSLGLTEIYTFDKKMDRYPGVTRIEP